MKQSKAKPYWRTWPKKPRLPSPRLLAWLNHLGTKTVARSLVCSEYTVRQWKRGRMGLSVKLARAVICNSYKQKLPDGTVLNYEDCLGPVVEERSEKREVKKSVPERSVRGGRGIVRRPQGSGRDLKQTPVLAAGGGDRGGLSQLNK